MGDSNSAVRRCNPQVLWGQLDVGRKQRESRMTFLASGSFTEMNCLLSVYQVDSVRTEWCGELVRCWCLSLISCMSLLQVCFLFCHALTASSKWT